MHLWTAKQSENQFQSRTSKKPTAQTNKLSREMLAANFKIQTANGNVVKVTKQLLLRFFLARRSFEETLLILPTMGVVLIGMTFYEFHLVTIDVKNRLVHLPDISAQVRRKSGTKYLNNLLELQTTQKMMIPPFQQVMLLVQC